MGEIKNDPKGGLHPGPELILTNRELVQNEYQPGLTQGRSYFDRYVNGQPPRENNDPRNPSQSGLDDPDFIEDYERDPNPLQDMIKRQKGAVAVDAASITRLLESDLSEFEKAAIDTPAKAGYAIKVLSHLQSASENGSYAGQSLLNLNLLSDAPEQKALRDRLEKCYNYHQEQVVRQFGEQEIKNFESFLKEKQAPALQVQGARLSEFAAQQFNYATTDYILSGLQQKDSPSNEFIFRLIEKGNKIISNPTHLSDLLVRAGEEEFEEKKLTPVMRSILDELQRNDQSKEAKYGAALSALTSSPFDPQIDYSRILTGIFKHTSTKEEQAAILKNYAVMQGFPNEIDPRNLLFIKLKEKEIESDTLKEQLERGGANRERSKALLGQNKDAIGLVLLELIGNQELLPEIIKSSGKDRAAFLTEIQDPKLKQILETAQASDTLMLRAQVLDYAIENKSRVLFESVNNSVNLETQPYLDRAHQSILGSDLEKVINKQTSFIDYQKLLQLKQYSEGEMKSFLGNVK